MKIIKMEMEAVEETKLLDYNVDKSGFLVTRPQKANRLIHKEYQRKPLTLRGIVMKEETDKLGLSWAKLSKAGAELGYLVGC